MKVSSIVFFGILELFLASTPLLAQLPDAHSFCSHSPENSLPQRTAIFDYSRADVYDVGFYHLNLRAETINSFIKGTVEIKAKAVSQSVDTMTLELSPALQVNEIRLNGFPVGYGHSAAGILQIYFPKKISKDEIFSVEVNYEGLAVASEGRGYNSQDNGYGSRVSWTLSEPFYSKDWWPCKQDLTDKADSVWVFVSTAKENKVGSNGLLSQVVALDDERVRYEWKSRYPIDYYLISIAVSDYMEYSFYSAGVEQEKVFIQNYLYPDSSLFKSQKMLIDCTALQMGLLQEKYGTYPFIEEKYGHCLAPIGGGMEHQTMTTQRDFNFHLSIHEMGHSWFGNQVTCARWNDIWINEGFATYTQYLGLEFLADKPTADAFMAAMQSVVMREPDGSVFVPEEFIEDRNRIFSSRLSYYKGAVIIHVIRQELANDELFFHVLQAFQQEYKYKTATAEDFRQVLEELSGMDFEAFFDVWYYGEGYPVYDFEWTQNAGGQFTFTGIQESSTPKSDFFPMNYQILVFFSQGGDTVLTLNQTLKEQKEQWVFNQRVESVIVNPFSAQLMDIRSIFEGTLLPGEIRVEPNPATDVFLLRFANSESDRSIEVYDASLRLVYTTKTTERTVLISSTDWSAGLYTIRIKTANGEQTMKLIKI